MISAFEIALATVASLCFGVSFGHTYGVDNQVVYLLGSLRLLDGSILQRDWFATQTTHYHPTFKYLGAALIALDRQGRAVAIAQTLTITGGILCVYALLRALCGARRALPAFLLLLAIASITRTSAPGSTYVFDWILQPSTLGSVGLLGAAAFFARGRWLASGLCAAGGGLFHMNYLVLLIMALGVAHLALGREGLVGRLLLQLVPPSLVLFLFLPMLLGATSSPAAAEAQRITFEIRSPHHYEPSTFESGFQGSVAWMLLGGAGTLCIATRYAPAARRLAAFIGGLSLVIWAGIVMSTLVHVPKVTHLFTWRIGPHANLLLQAVACAGAVTVLTDPRSARKAPTLALMLALGGAGVIGMLYGNRDATALPQVVLGATVAAAVVAFASDAMRTLGTGTWNARLGRALRQVATPVLLLGALAVFVSATREQLAKYEDRSNVPEGIRKHEADLCQWMREKSPKEARFLTPPDLETIRYWGQRAIVVDWKSNPGLPDEVLEWFRRLKDVTGRPKFSSRKDLAGYDDMDAARLAKLSAQYDVDYAVIRARKERALDGYPVVFSNGHYAVLDVRGKR
ncbi:Hypothetical protein CAP_7445 [Chondromyces apiculatus DSM 436]|uniref:DUF6798 domain-containing protein n=1 Tax=Chondromyces apiculatus DSM 436 TaxID=1192034 RepID=A0A017SZU8_9BACT|nr:Hypothetical protein CAP_7445 [Chondromyces apiculatus DSM 436]